jgi:hypothetical protein
MQQQQGSRVSLPHAVVPDASSLDLDEPLIFCPRRWCAGKEDEGGEQELREALGHRMEGRRSGMLARRWVPHKKEEPTVVAAVSDPWHILSVQMTLASTRIADRSSNSIRDAVLAVDTFRASAGR